MQVVMSEPLQSRQKGAVLIVGLIILVILTILGTSAMQTNVLQENMAGNLKDFNRGFQATEAALRVGESDLAEFAVQPELVTAEPVPSDPTRKIWIYAEGDTTTDGTGCITDKTTTPWTPWWSETACKTSGWWNSTNVNSRRPLPTDQKNVLDTEVANAPRHVVEYMGFVEDSLNYPTYTNPQTGRDFYRITARGEGGTEKTAVLLQSTFAWRYE